MTTMSYEYRRKTYSQPQFDTKFVRNVKSGYFGRITPIWNACQQDSYFVNELSEKNKSV